MHRSNKAGPKSTYYDDTFGEYLAAAVSNNALFSSMSARRACVGWTCCSRLHIELVHYLRHKGTAIGELVNIRFQVCTRLSCQHIQHDRVGNQLRICGVLLQRSGQRRLSLGQPAQVKLCDCLADNGQRGGRAGRGGEFLVDVEGGLVLLTTLHRNRAYQHYVFTKQGRLAGNVQHGCQPTIRLG